MLQNLFISPSPLSILSLYLSATFDRILPLPQLLIRMPYNSDTVASEVPTDSSRSFSSMESCPGSPMAFKVQPTPPVAPKVWDGGPDDFKNPIASSSCALNLARRFHTVAACKEAMWAEYEKQYSHTPIPSIRNSSENTTRGEFEFHWSNWVEWVVTWNHAFRSLIIFDSDMTDRIDMRNILESTLTWEIPITCEPLSSTAWRDRCGVIDVSEDHNDTEGSEKALCRSMRCFLAWKT